MNTISKVILAAIFVLISATAQAHTVTWNAPGQNPIVYECDSYASDSLYFYCYRTNQHPITIVRASGDSFTIK